MEVEYASRKLEEQCEKLSAARKLFGGNETLAKALLARIQQLKAAVTLRDIICLPTLRFHALHNKGKSKLEGYFAIDVRDPGQNLGPSLVQEGVRCTPRRSARGSSGSTTAAA